MSVESGADWSGRVFHHHHHHDDSDRVPAWATGLYEDVRLLTARAARTDQVLDELECTMVTVAQAVQDAQQAQDEQAQDITDLKDKLAAAGPVDPAVQAAMDKLDASSQAVIAAHQAVTAAVPGDGGTPPGP